MLRIKTGLQADPTGYGAPPNRVRSSILCLFLVLILAFSEHSEAHPAHAKPVKYPFVVGFERFYTDLDTPEHLAKGGMILLNELNCVACHQPPDHLQKKLTGRTGSRMQGVADRFDHLDLEMMIRNPRFVKTDTIMPSLFSGPDRDLDEIKALKHFLSTLKNPKPLPKYAEGDIEKGRLLYHKVGCVACHAPEVDFRPPWVPEGIDMYTTSMPSVPMNLADRYPREALIDLIKHPNHYRPAGRMPRFELEEQQLIDIGTYLNSTPKPELPDNLLKAMEQGPPFELDSSMADTGRKLFTSKNCVACHDGVVEAEPILSKPLAELTTEKEIGCLSRRPPGGGVPAFGLDVLQKKAITEALRRIDDPEPASIETEVDWTFSTRNCYSCHERHSKGGPEAAREVFFTVENPDAIPHGRWATHPPVLDQVGSKLKPEVWKSVLFGDGEASRLRPFMTARMPVYRHQDLGGLVENIQKLDNSASTVKPVDFSKGDPERGRQLLGNSGQNCVACHGLGGLSAPDAVSVDLDGVTSRLTPEYFASLIRDPQKFYADIPMPAYPLDDQAIADIWTYLAQLDKQALPSGLLKPDVTELKPTDSAIVLRAALVDISEDAILIGFPSGNHFAFDIASCEWIGYWQGRFIDPGEDWESSEAVGLKPQGKWTKLKLRQETEKKRFIGYKTNNQGNPELHIEINNQIKVFQITSEGMVTSGSATINLIPK